MKRFILALILVNSIFFMAPCHFVPGAMLAPGQKTFHGTLTAIKDVKDHYEITIDKHTFLIFTQNNSRLINQARLLMAKKVSTTYQTATKKVGSIWLSKEKTLK